MFRFNNQYDMNCYDLYDFQTMSKLVQIQYDTNCYDSYDVQTCLNFYRCNMIRIVMILKHVRTYSNMSKLGQIKYDMNCYDSQTCLNMFINMFKHV